MFMEIPRKYLEVFGLSLGFLKRVIKTPMSLSHREFYEFGPFTLDADERLVSRDGTALAMTPKVFDTLLHLVRNQGRVLTKDELVQKIWPDTFVEEVNLAVNISTLRRLLGEGPQDGRYIVTVSGRGYRFVAPVHAISATGKKLFEDPTAPEPVRETSVATVRDIEVEGDDLTEPHLEPGGQDVSAVAFSPNRSNRLLIAILSVIAVLLITVVGIFFTKHRQIRRAPRLVSASIAVLPFADLSEKKDQEFFSDGLADELTNDLAKVRGLKVIARSSAFQFKGKNEDLRTVGHQLGVSNILEGSVRREGNRVRITAELTKVDDGFQLWSETYDRQIDDVLAVQDDIARAVSVALQVRILGPDQGVDAAHFRRNPAAYEAYLQAQYFLARGEDKQDLEKALGYIDQAIKIDPDFAPAFALRSSATNTAATIGLLNHEESFHRAKEDAEKAIALDRKSATGYVALAWVKINYEWDWHGAEIALQEAASLQPGSAVILSYRAYLYQCLGRLDEAIALTEQASVLDPLRTNAYLGELLSIAGRFEESQAALRKALAINPEVQGAHAKLGNILLMQGDAQSALVEMKREPGEWERLTGEALVYGALERSQESDSALSKLISLHSDDSPYQIAEVYAYRGNVDKAFDWLERAYHQRDPGLNQLRLDPFLKSLRSDPRYTEMLRRIKLSD